MTTRRRDEDDETVNVNKRGRNNEDQNDKEELGKIKRREQRWREDEGRACQIKFHQHNTPGYYFTMK